MITLSTQHAASARVPGARAQIAHRADDAFPFLHDTMIARLGGRLLLAWYNCTEDEIVGRTVIRGRWSSDEGMTWSAPEIIAEDLQGVAHMVPVTFSEYGGEIWAYATSMASHDRPTGYRCYRYERNGWVERERRSEPLLINTLPQSVGADWLAGGRMAAVSGELPLIPVVVRSRPQAPADWQVQPLPGPWNRGEYPLHFPETALLADGSRVDAIIRNDAGPALCCASADGGVTWGEVQPCDMPIVPSKLFGGTLPDGRQYLIYNERIQENEPRDRSRLVIALRRNADTPFDRIWTIADGFSDTLDAGPFWHYPCACTSGGYLHVSCTASAHSIVRHAAVFSLPLDEL